MLASEVMTRDVLTVGPETPIADAAATMAKAHVSGLPVVDPGGILLGIVTEGDLLRRAELGTAPARPAWLNFLRGPELAAADYVRTRSNHVEDIMTPAPVSVPPEAGLDAVVGVMEKHRVRRVPVVREGKLEGIVSRSDLVKVLARMMATGAPAHRNDAAIRDDVLAAFGRHDWYALCEAHVSVEGGRVLLEGMVRSDAIRSALRVAAERVPGVVSVDNQVQLLDPAMSAMGI